MNELKTSTIGKQTTLTLGLVLMLLGAVVSIAVKDAVWKTNVARDLSEIREEVNSIERRLSTSNIAAADKRPRLDPEGFEFSFIRKPSTRGAVDPLTKGRR